MTAGLLAIIGPAIGTGGWPGSGLGSARVASQEPSVSPGPTILDLSVFDVRATNVRVTWTLDVPATGQVEYGTTADYGTLTNPELSFDYSTHVQVLRDLLPDTQYHFRVISSDSAGATTMSPDTTFTTAPETPAPTMIPMASLGPTPSDGSTPPVGLMLPPSIDATGATDVSADVQSFVDDAPNGSTIVFPRGATYRIDEGILLVSRHDLVFEGQGATLIGSGCDVADSVFLLRADDQRIVFRDFVLVGDNPGGYFRGCESSEGIAMYGARDIEIDNVTVRDFYGHCWIADQRYGWSEDIHIHDSTCERAGVTGIAILAARNVIVERTTFTDIALFPFDIEPDDDDGGGVDIMFRDNIVDGFGLSPEYSPWVFAAATDHGTITNVTFTRNHILRSAPDSNPWRTTAAGLTVAMYGDARKQNIVISDNISEVPGVGPAMQFEHVDGLTIVGNVQPLTSGELARIEDSTEVVYLP